MSVFDIFSKAPISTAPDDSVDERIMPPWEFPDPVMQADADMRKRIAELESENAYLADKLSSKEMLSVWKDNLEARENNLAFTLHAMQKTMDHKIEQTVQIRTITLKEKIVLLEAKLYGRKAA